MSSGVVPPPYGVPQFQPPAAPADPQQPGGLLPWGPAPASYLPGPGVPYPPPYHPDLRFAGPVGGGLPQRPAVIALAVTLAVVASLQWICALSLLWVSAAVGTSTFDQVGDNGALFHILNRFDDRMLDGLAVPLFGFPLASLVTGFLVIKRRPWTRLVHTLVGVAALAWAAWWLRDNLLWWFSAAWYVVVACLVLWTPAASAWYRWRTDEAERLTD